MLDTGDLHKFTAHTVFGVVECANAVERSLLRESIAKRVLEAVVHATSSSPHSQIAKSLCAQGVIAYLEDFAPKDFTIETLLDQTTPRSTPVVLAKAINIALHFRADSSLSPRDYVFWAQRIKPAGFVAMSEMHPATGDLLGLNSPTGLTGAALFKALWNLDVGFDVQGPAPKGVEYVILKKILDAIGASTRKHTIRGLKPSTQGKETKHTVATNTPGVRPAIPPAQSAVTTKEPRTTPRPTQLRSQRSAPPAKIISVVKSIPVEKKNVAPAAMDREPQARTPQAVRNLNSLTLPETVSQPTPPIPAAAVAPAKKQTEPVSKAQAVNETPTAELTSPPSKAIEPPTQNESQQATDQIEQPEAAPTRLNREELIDLLMNARNADWTEIVFDDGRSLSGALVFNEFRGTGRLINVDQEFTFDFSVDNVVDVRI